MESQGKPKKKQAKTDEDQHNPRVASDPRTGPRNLVSERAWCILSCILLWVTGLPVFELKLGFYLKCDAHYPHIEIVVNLIVVNFFSFLAIAPSHAH